MKFWLEARWPLDDGREIVVDRYPFVIGRRSDNDFPLPLAFVSRRHCQFILANDQVMVQDLESYNGTFVNGARASLPLPIHNGDEITLGPCGFRVVMSSERQETADGMHGPTCREEVIADPAELGKSTSLSRK
jgi:pSer/pThr/pTyr-binding forkhead associated (FHA) protein